MTDRMRDAGLGIGLMAVALALILWIVPGYVVSPAGGRMVLRPDFWPTVLSWALLAAGAGVLGRALRAEPGGAAEEAEAPARPGAALRLAALAVLLAAIAVTIERFGMVWVAMGAFVLVAATTGSPRPLATLGVAVLLPLALYVFFSKFAGVPIPQGAYLRLP